MQYYIKEIFDQLLLLYVFLYLLAEDFIFLFLGLIGFLFFLSAL